MGGAPCIRELRIPVSVVVDMVTEGLSHDEILELFPDLRREDIPAALGYAWEGGGGDKLALVQALIDESDSAQDSDYSLAALLAESDD
jgi:uncharacterized protein (DUF433 family)